MATYTELEARCKRRFGRRGMTITTEFLDEMQAAQEKLEKSPALPKWMKVTTGDLPTAAGLVILTDIPPTDFLRVYDDLALVYDADDGKEKRAVRLDTRDQLVSKRNAGVVGDAIYWYLLSDSVVEIVPAQTVIRTFRMTYYAGETLLTGGNTNNWCSKEGELIMGMAGIELATWLRDDRALKYFANLAATERNRMVNQIEADEWGDTDLVMGDPD